MRTNRPTQVSSGTEIRGNSSCGHTRDEWESKRRACCTLVWLVAHKISFNIRSKTLHNFFEMKLLNSSRGNQLCCKSAEQLRHHMISTYEPGKNFDVDLVGDFAKGFSDNQLPLRVRFSRVLLLSETW